MTNYHTHSLYCDGAAPLRNYVELALAHGFSHLGFSGHSPLPFQNNYSIKADRYPDYCREVRDLQTEFAGRIAVALGLEIDYVPGLCDDFGPLKEQGGLDYVIGSVHLIPAPGAEEQLRRCPEEADRLLWMIDGPRYQQYDDGLFRLFGGDIRRAVRAFFDQTNRMIVTQRPTIVGHFDKVVMHNRGRYFYYDEPWFRSLVGETVSLIAETGCICEVNTRGLYKKRHTDYYPARPVLCEMAGKGIPLIVSTDAHAPADLMQFEGIYDYLRSIAYPSIVSHL